jgi:hypothetical protein
VVSPEQLADSDEDLRRRLSVEDEIDNMLKQAKQLEKLQDDIRDEMGQVTVGGALHAAKRKNQRSRRWYRIMAGVKPSLS